MKTWRLQRTRQCAKCPWKVKTNPRDIPDGYSVDKHKALRQTIAEPGKLSCDGIAVMACHDTEPGQQVHCIGWLVNQIGDGNNIPLRIKMMSCENAREIQVVGEQHKAFEDTLPEDA